MNANPSLLVSLVVVPQQSPASREVYKEPSAADRDLALLRLRRIATAFREKMTPVESTQVGGTNQWRYGQYRRDFYHAVMSKAHLV